VVVRLTTETWWACSTRQVHGEIYLAMEFVEGKDLRAVWNRCAQKGIAFPLRWPPTLSRSWCGAWPMRTISKDSVWSTAMYRRQRAAFLLG